MAPPEFDQSGDGKQSFKYSLIKNSQIQLGLLHICYKETWHLADLGETNIKLPWQFLLYTILCINKAEFSDFTTEKDISDFTVSHGAST